MEDVKLDRIMNKDGELLWTQSQTFVLILPEGSF